MRTDIFKTAMAWIGCIALSFCTLSCGDDNDNPAPDTGGNNDNNALVAIHYEVNVSEDLLYLYDIEMSYLDENGQRKTGTITSTTWSFIKTMPLSSAPSEFDCHITANAKNPRPAIDKDKYTISTSCKGYAAKTSSDGKSILATYGTMSPSNKNFAVQASKLDTYLEKYSTLTLINYSATKE